MPIFSKLFFLKPICQSLEDDEEVPKSLSFAGNRNHSLKHRQSHCVVKDLRLTLLQSRFCGIAWYVATVSSERRRAKPEKSIVRSHTLVACICHCVVGTYTNSSI